MVNDLLYYSYHEKCDMLKVEFAINIEVALKVNLSSVTYELVCLFTHWLIVKHFL
jgi:hypothetical protein